ncbi:MAG: ATP-binding protein [Candidatus Omnitrophica bacterium]|nr:ATP-binding protein [Candidatus Omnitrophota bacterium]MDD5488584.1 ATP-binding protein [Candidatus Omnitrophota bacterium]
MNSAEYEKELEELRRVAETHKVLNKLLQYSIGTTALPEFLEFCIDSITSAPLFPGEQKGAIFLVEDGSDTLVMKAQKGLAEHLLTSCANVPFGQCLCGHAAATRKLVYTSHVDEQHTTRYEGMPQHGHYCVPILLEDKLLGVLNLYVKKAHIKNNDEVDFLTAVTDVLALVINNHLMEEQIGKFQVQLLKSGKLASIGQLAAGIAHEINNPIGFVGSNLNTFTKYMDNYARLIEATDALRRAIDRKDTKSTKEISERIASIEKEIDMDFVSKDIGDLIKESKDGISRIKDLISDLKTFTHSSGNAPETVCVQDVIENVLKIVSHEIKNKVEISREYLNTPCVNCDPQKLGQVLVNLMVNAAQAIEKKGIISIKIYPDGGYSCIDISDTGSGIPRDIIGKIFDPFFTTKASGIGTGLGLSISKDIIHQIGGDLLVRSEVGKGTTFTVKLPIQQ